MDTDDLTEMAYQSIVMADRITEYLKCDLGVRSKDYEDEESYLRGILKFVRRIKTDPEGYLDSWNLLDDIDLDAFIKGIEGLEEHILKTIEMPLRQRGETS